MTLIQIMIITVVVKTRKIENQRYFLKKIGAQQNISIKSNNSTKNDKYLLLMRKNKIR